MPGTNDSVVQYYLSCADVSKRYIYTITTDQAPEITVNTKDSDVPVWESPSIYGHLKDSILNGNQDKPLYTINRTTKAETDNTTEKQEEKKDHDGKTVRSMISVFHCTEDDIIKLKKAVDQYGKTYPGLAKLIVHDHNALTDTDWERIAETCKSIGATGTYVLSASDGLVHVKSRSGNGGSALIL